MDCFSIPVGPTFRWICDHLRIRDRKNGKELRVLNRCTESEPVKMMGKAIKQVIGEQNIAHPIGKFHEESRHVAK
jgi:hypothetical protein